MEGHDGGKMTYSTTMEFKRELNTILLKRKVFYNFVEENCVLKMVVPLWKDDDYEKIPFNIGEEGDFCIYKNFHFYIKKKYKKCMRIVFIMGQEYFGVNMRRRFIDEVVANGDICVKDWYDKTIQKKQKDIIDYMGSTPKYQTQAGRVVVVKCC